MKKLNLKAGSFKLSSMSKKTVFTARPFVPASHSLKRLADAAQECRGCDLYKNATQAVFGEGLKKSRIMFVGEAPGDREDVEGHPFVGPAGRLFDKALKDAGIQREDAFVTNAVKHFKSIPRGKLRLHQKPNTAEVKACRPWLEAEIETVKPEIIVCLGATAVRSVFGRTATIKSLRGAFHKTELSAQTFVTTHPSAILRSLPQDHEKNYKAFVEDLKVIRKRL